MYLSKKKKNLVERSGVSADEIGGAFDVTVLEVVFSDVVKKGVLKGYDPAAVEGGSVGGDPQRHRNAGGAVCVLDGQKTADEVRGEDRDGRRLK